MPKLWYLKKSYDIIMKLHALWRVPRHAWLFTADTISMHTNMDPKDGLYILEKYIRYFGMELARSIGFIYRYESPAACDY